MNSTRKLWAGVAVLLIASFAVLLWVCSEIHRQAPPMPEQVVTTDGTVLYTRQDIETGRQVWQSIGGQQLGSIWGHGGYVAPDWGADWLHREAEAILDLWAAREHGVDSYRKLDAPTQAAYSQRVQALLRPNTWDQATGTITIDPDRAQAMATVAAHYASLFGNDPATAELLRETGEALEELADWTPAAMEERLRTLAERRGIGGGKLFQPLRVALTGMSVSPGIFEVMELLGRDRTLRRIAAAVTYVTHGNI